MSEVENTLVEVTADQKLKKERLVNLKNMAIESIQYKAQKGK